MGTLLLSSFQLFPSTTHYIIHCLGRKLLTFSRNICSPNHDSCRYCVSPPIAARAHPPATCGYRQPLSKGVALIIHH